MLQPLTRRVSKRLYPPIQLDACDDSLYGHVEGLRSYRVSRSLKAGYYMIEFCPAGECASAAISVEGNEGLTFPLPVRSSRLTKRIIRIPFAAHELVVRLFSVEGGGGSELEYLRLVPLSLSFAVRRMSARLSLGLIKVHLLARKRGMAYQDYLFSAYDRSFKSDSEGEYQSWLDSVEPGLLKKHAPQVLLPLDILQARYKLCKIPGFVLSVGAEQMLASVLEKNPSAVLVYADEDQSDHLGARSHPWFKPDWSPDLFLSHDYLSSCFMCRRDWFDQHQAVFERSSVRAALLALLPDMSNRHILHLPLVLVHRVGADEAQEEPTRTAATLSAGECNAGAFEVLPGLRTGSLRLKYALPVLPPLVSLLIPTRDGLHVLRPCVESILEKTDYSPYEILILDNQSREPETLAWLADIQRDPRVSVLPYNQPFNYSAINNFGARHARGSVIGLINNDVEVISPGWLTEMVSQACRPEIGCVGAKLYYSNGQIQHGGVILGLGHVAGHAHRFLARDADGYHGRLKLVQNYSAVTAACLLVRREIFEQVGGLEETHLTVAYNDVDFCLRVRAAGYRNLWTPYAELYHHESISRGEDDTPEKKARYDKEVAYMWRTWRKELEYDPCYNPNLSRRREDFSLRELLS